LEEELPHVRASRGETVEDLELCARRVDGTLAHVLANAAPVRDGRPGSAVAVLRDITPRKRLQEEREAWTSIIAHDLRQPASVIATAARLLEQRAAPLDANEAKAVAWIRAGVDTLVRMIDDLLDATLVELRQLPLKQQRMDLAQVVHDVVQRCQPSLGDHGVRVKAPSGPVILTADPDRVGQVVANLLSNAAKYGAPGTNVDVRIAPSDQNVEVSVTNRGVGLRPEEAARLFERFYRTQAAKAGEQGGLGLGLYVVKGIVEGHGGRIAVESTPGKTTTFRFWLPRGTRAAPGE
jgi:signal transduction histidine kinase